MPQPLCRSWSHATRVILIVGDCQLAPNWSPNWLAWIGIPRWLWEGVAVCFVSEEVAVMLLCDTLIMTCQTGCTASLYPPGYDTHVRCQSLPLCRTSHRDSAWIQINIKSPIVLNTPDRIAVMKTHKRIRHAGTLFYVESWCSCRFLQFFFFLSRIYRIIVEV